ncbi:aldose 1-epimerase family protein [Robertmurraya korlensis]|uniref:aldose 1-epimerase family protein n=1 Tax=Robertmurraya korlensis TaxID=519977 RepID=UPI002041F805|nr:aldose 1-epimerase family protein [Robertmurraya korlensis]MCM3601664.1 aldose 1-epimerase family protein [Robertmurraya korlensis]
MITVENEWLKVEIESHGAEVRKVKHKKNGLDYMWTGDNKYWGRVSPVLFPIVGRLKDDQYQIHDQTYKMSQHGFLRDVEFHILEQTATNAAFMFESAGRFSEVYPYEFKAIIRYMLKGDSLIVHWEIVNENEKEMHFAIGAHPAFKIPLLENETIEDYQLHFTPAVGKNVIEYELQNSLLKEKGSVNEIGTLPLTNSLFACDALVYSNIDKITLVSKKSSHGVEVLFEDFPFVGIWSKYIPEDDSIAPFVCIEPWYGVADTYDTTGNFSEKFGNNKLEPGNTFHAEYLIRFK